MLMEPDEYTSQERALTDKAKELIEQHELDWGNGECFIQRDAGHSELYMTLEAPNHATVTVTVPAEADEKGLRRAMADGLLDFDPDEEFDECWSREFAARNGVRGTAASRRDGRSSTRWWTTAGSPAKTKARRPKRPKPTIPRTRPTR